VSSSELREALGAIFNGTVVALNRSLSLYSSSFTIEELDVTLDNGRTVKVIFKNLSSDSMLEGARLAKPEFLYAPEREISVYRSLLSSLQTGPPRFFGATVDATLQRYWLFLEKVPGRELYEIGDFETWLSVARWLARFHASWEAELPRTVEDQLLKYDASYYRRWFQRARESAGSLLNPIAAGYDHVIDVLISLPCTFIHGEFYASNILVQEHENELRVCPVDWEMAAIGPGLFDLAALASGKWSRDERSRMLEEYLRMLPQRLRPQDQLLAFQCCQLQCALQWLGWSRTWSPPLAHAQDWQAEAIRISREEPLATLLQ
jgi:thiamine kinase-like enzyme